MRILMAAIAAVLSIGVMSPAHADSDVQLIGQYRECWDKGNTLYHFTVFNYGDTRAHVTYEYTLSDSDKVFKGKFSVPKSQGYLGGIEFKPSQTITSVKAYSDGELFMYRTRPVKPKCC